MKENKLIAEFMGLEESPKYNYDNIEKLKEYYIREYNSGEWYLPEEMQYHTSWDWLMPVVREVLTIVDINLVNYFVDELKFCVLDNDIDGAFEEVVEFINYLNKTNNN